MINKSQKFFLGANSCEGFISHFEDAYSMPGYRAYLIKGGPGTGKSSLMKFLTSKGIDAGEEPILCPCSSDPYSLDAVIFEKRKIAVLDATSPHTLEPRLPGARENIINLGHFWNDDMLFSERDKIAEAAAINSKFHKTASGYLKGCGEIIGGMLSLSIGCSDAIKTASYAKKTAEKLLKRKNRKGTEQIRFLQGVTPIGLVSYTDTIDNFYENKVIISDPYGGVAPIFMEQIRQSAKTAGYDIITVKSAFLPRLITDHILIPELSLCFATENSSFKLKSEGRRIHARRFMDAAAISACKNRLQFRKKIARELIAAACETLQSAKKSHDILEQYYVSAMDFNGISVYAERLADEIFER